MRDATAAFTEEEMHAALDINPPNYVNAIVTTGEIVGAIARASECSASSLVPAVG